MTDAYRHAFKEEAYELLADLENSLLELEESPDDTELIGKVFRSMHTIKGSGAMFGFDDIASFTHEVETVFDKVRSGKMCITSDLINLTLKARDTIKAMLDDDPPGEAHSGNTPEEIIDALKRLSSGGEETPKTPHNISSTPEWALPPPISDDLLTYRIRFIPSPAIFLSGTNPLPLLDELRSLGESEVVAQFDHIPPLEEINPEHCYTYWDIVLSTNKGIDVIKDVFIFVEDECTLTIDIIDKNTVPTGDEEYKKLGEILVERGDIRKEQLDMVLHEKKYLGEMLIEKGLATPDKVESALIEQQQVKKIREKTKANEEGTASIRVAANKLDTLVNLVGEMVTIQAQLSQIASTATESVLVSIAEEVERLTGELRDNILNIRMLPIGSTFGKFKRLVRDLSQELGKEIELTTDGADTELDKTVIEKLNDPLVHLIRNCIDHAIEPPEERTSLGKIRTGTIHLSALHSGAHVVIGIRDDGRGLDKEMILAKAIEKGLIFSGQDLTEQEIFNFIFAPGFSTARKITGVSGRGVGMDVVKKAIGVLRGSIDIQSIKGEGTMITIKLPLTLAIIDGLLVQVRENCFVLPLSIVEECVELTREDIKNSHGRNIANIRGEIVPYIRLRSEFSIPGEMPPIEQIVVTGVNGNRIGLVVDEVIGEHQTVIKNLGKFYKDADSISGATILGDGRVALIVDVAKVVKNVELSEAVFG